MAIELVHEVQDPNEPTDLTLFHEFMPQMDDIFEDDWSLFNLTASSDVSDTSDFWG